MASRFAYDAGMAPFAFVAWRATIGAVGLWLVVLALRRPGGVRAQFAGLDSRGRRWLTLGVLLAAGVNLSTFLAFDYTSVALALLGFYTYPAMVAAGAVLLGRERLDPLRALAVVLALAGMAAVVGGGATADVRAGTRSDLLGVALALFGAVMQATWVLTSRRYARLADDQAMATTLTGCAAVALVLSAAVVGPDSLAFPLDRPDLFPLLLFVGLFAAALPSTLLLMGIRWIGGVRTGIVMLIEPVVGVLLAAAFLAEALEPVQLAGGATILVAAVLAQRSSRRSVDELDGGAVVPAPGGP